MTHIVQGIVLMYSAAITWNLVHVANDVLAFCALIGQHGDNVLAFCALTCQHRDIIVAWN